MVHGGAALLGDVPEHRLLTARPIRQRAFYLAFRSAVGLLGLLPRRWAQRLGRLGGVVGYWTAPGRRRMAIRHARRLGAARPRSHARRVFAAYGRYWAEVFWFRPRRIPELEATTEVEGIEHVRRALAGGHGVVLALPHVGNWEVAGPVGVQEQMDLWAVAEDLRNRRIRDWFVALRNRLGIGIVLAGGSVMRELEGILRRNGAVALVCDRDLRGRGVPVEFFGEVTTLPAGPARLSLRTGAPIVPVAAFFRPDGGHRVVVRPPIDLGGIDGRERPEAVKEITRRVARALEELIRCDPEQWHLLQPNWPSDLAEGG